MATVNTDRALAEYQRRLGAMANEIVMRDVAIAELEARVAELESQLVAAANGSAQAG